MRGKLALLLASALMLGAAPVPSVADQRARLRTANTEAAAADARSDALERQAAGERDEARRAAGREAAVVARIVAAEAEIAAAAARVAITDRQLAAQHARLTATQAPILRLVAAVQSLARRPAAVAVVQPGSTADIVHVRAVLGTLLPMVQARTAAVRSAVEQTRALRRNADLAARSLSQGRARLQGERLALVRMEGEHRLRGRNLDRSALVESDRAIALGERARSLADQMATTESAADIRDALADLPGPLPRPGAGEAAARFVVPPYRLPVRGRVVEGLGEVASTGVRSRGLMLATAPGAVVVAPAGGRILFARRFRDYGAVVIIDHGGDWSSAITGLDAADVRVGDRVAAGRPIGRAVMGDDPRVGVELRRRGMPIDLAQLLG